MNSNIWPKIFLTYRLMIIRILRRPRSRLPSIPRMYRWWSWKPCQIHLPLPQRNHLQPRIFHLRLVVQLRLLRSWRTLLFERRYCCWTWSCHRRWIPRICLISTRIIRFPKRRSSSFLWSWQTRTCQARKEVKRKLD